MYRIFLVVLTWLCVLTVVGCKTNLNGGADNSHATTVTFNQFQQANKDEKVFWFIGSDADFVYFRTKKGFYRIASNSNPVPKSWVEESKRRFEQGVPLGKVNMLASFRGEKIGLPEPGADTNLSYSPRE